ncbi:MAG: hypothetical protein MI742_10495 [Desulfobacterales bacterium]|nr:hypothetical protein [Desulfobacterales bacterium]
MISQPIPSFRSTYAMLLNAHLPQIIANAIDVGLFDAMKDGPMTAPEIASTLEADEAALRALMKILITSGYMKGEEGQFSLSPESKNYFVSSSPAYQGAVVQSMIGMKEVFGKGGSLLKNGCAPHNDRMWASTDMMEMMGQSAWGGKIQSVVALLTSLPEFSCMRRMCDIAGSCGYYSMGILDAAPEMVSTVFDLPEVVELSLPIVDKKGYADRLIFKGVDLEGEWDVESGYDLVFVSNYLYRWSVDERLSQFLRKMYASLNPGGVFLSCHLTSEVEGDHFLSQQVIEYLTRLGGYPTHNITEVRMARTLEETGFVNFSIQRPDDASYDNTLLVAARKPL